MSSRAAARAAWRTASRHAGPILAATIAGSCVLTVAAVIYLGRPGP